MKACTLTQALAATVLVAAMVFVGCTRKESTTAREGTSATGAAAGTDAAHNIEPEHNEGESHTHPHPDGEHHGAEVDHGPIPTTLAGIWTEVREEQKELGDAIAEKRLTEVHAIAFRIRDLVVAMPPLTDPSVPKQNLEDSIQRIRQMAALLDQYGDAGDLAATQNQKTRLDSVLDYIQSLYPSGVLAG